MAETNRGAPAAILYMRFDSNLAIVKLKQAAPKITDPGNSTKSAIQKGKAGNQTKQLHRHSLLPIESKKARATPTPSSIASPGPVVNQLSDSVRESFETGRPMEDSPDLSICGSCKRSYLTSASNEHLKKCSEKNGPTEKKLKSKKNKALEKELKAKSVGHVLVPASAVVDKDKDSGSEEEDAEGEVDATESKGMVGLKKGAKKSAGKAAAGVTKGKKRKAEGESEKAPKAKKKKEEAKPKVAKPKGPVDVERQCGVITPSGTAPFLFPHAY